MAAGFSPGCNSDDSTNTTATHNIQTNDYGEGEAMTFGGCTGTCTFDYNVTDDNSATGETHGVTDWTPSWTSTGPWSPWTGQSKPSGYYAPSGLGISAGASQNIGP